jgi:phosphoserine aminotransferase
MLTMQWLKDMGGISAIEDINNKKARLLYSEIELSPVFEGYANKEDRSHMNATFNITDAKLKDTFDSMLKEAGINGLNGHRSVGGYRASMYNALSLESVGILVDIMSEMERKG